MREVPLSALVLGKDSRASGDESMNLIAQLDTLQFDRDLEAHQRHDETLCEEQYGYKESLESPCAAAVPAAPGALRHGSAVGLLLPSA